MQEHSLIEEDGIQTCVTKHELEVSKCIDWVTDPECGGISTFIGTTRNTFQGKRVLKLEYEAYVPMAQKKLREMSEAAMRKWDVRKISVWHRIDTVLIMEASVIIATSSPHRKDAIECCSWLIDELKATVPIWKKEFFEDGEIWKENAESRRLFGT